MKTSDRQLATLAECDRYPPAAAIPASVIGNCCEPVALRCDMTHGCTADVTHIDTAGFVYCAAHGLERRSYEPCRKLRPREIKQLKRGEPLKRYY